MVMSLNIVIRLKLFNRPGTLANVLTVIAREGGSLGAIDIISASPSYVTRELMIRLKDRSHLGGLVKALGDIPGVEVIPQGPTFLSGYRDRTCWTGTTSKK